MTISVFQSAIERIVYDILQAGDASTTVSTSRKKRKALDGNQDTENAAAAVEGSTRILRRSTRVPGGEAAAASANVVCGSYWNSNFLFRYQCTSVC